MSQLKTQYVEASSPSIDATELASLVQSFNDVTEKLEATHASLRSEVGLLKKDLAEAHARLARSRQLAALGEMAAGIAHEIRNPLGCIALTIDALRVDLVSMEPQLQLCGRLSTAVSRLDAIVGDVLSFARNTQVRPVCRALVPMIDAALANTADLIEQWGIDVEVKADPSIEAEFDATLLEQALVNVLRNACEAMAGEPEGDRQLSVDLEVIHLAETNAPTVAHAVLGVNDTGPGIPEDVRTRMFNPFFTTRNEGTGLGLAIVHRIIDGHGGRVNVLGLPNGTRIELALPLECTGAVSPDEEPQTSLAEAVQRRVQESADRGAA